MWTFTAVHQLTRLIIWVLLTTAVQIVGLHKKPKPRIGLSHNQVQWQLRPFLLGSMQLFSVCLLTNISRNVHFLSHLSSFTLSPPTSPPSPPHQYHVLCFACCIKIYHQINSLKINIIQSRLQRNYNILDVSAAHNLHAVTMFSANVGSSLICL